MTAKTPEGAASEGLSPMAAFSKSVPRPAPVPPVNKGGRRAAVTHADGQEAAPTASPFIGPQPPTAAQMTPAATAAPGLSKPASAVAAAVADVPLDATEKAAVLKAPIKEGQVRLCQQEMCAIASRYFSVALGEKNKKGLLVAALQAQIDARRGMLPVCVLDAAAITAAAVVAATAAATAAAAAEGDSEGGD